MPWRFMVRQRPVVGVIVALADMTDAAVFESVVRRANLLLYPAASHSRTDVQIGGETTPSQKAGDDALHLC